MILLSAGHKETARDHPHPSFSADGTRKVCAIQRCASYGNTVKSGLDDRILFRMNPPAELMPFTGRHIECLPKASGIFAVPNPAGGSVITGGQDSFIFDHDGTDSASEACGTLCYQFSDIHKVGFP